MKKLKSFVSTFLHFLALDSGERQAEGEGVKSCTHAIGEGGGGGGGGGGT